VRTTSSPEVSEASPHTTERDRLLQAAVALRREVATRIVGQDAVLDEILIALVAGGHALLVGVPGLAYNIFIGAIILGMMALHSWLERRHRAGT